MSLFTSGASRGSNPTGTAGIEELADIHRRMSGFDGSNVRRRYHGLIRGGIERRMKLGIQVDLGIMMDVARLDPFIIAEAVRNESTVGCMQCSVGEHTSREMA
jgi:hypothetical protein